MKTKSYIWIIISILALSSCRDMFDYSPYVIDFDEHNKNVNNTNISKIVNQRNIDSTITIAFTADSHRSSDELNDFVNRINNNAKIDFVVHLGDFADFGLPQQYLWTNSDLLKLNVPYVTVLGNHDLVGNGGDAYHEMFGDFNTSFIYDSVKFVLLNTNSLEFGMDGNVPDINWLDAQLRPQSNFKKAVVLFHVSPTHSEFDPNLISDFSAVTSKYNNVIFMAHGHMHDYGIYQPFADSLTYVNIHSLEHEKYNVIKIKDDEFEVSTYDL